MKKGLVLMVVTFLMVAGAFAGRALVEARMKTIIFEKIEFRSIRFSEAIEYLRSKSKELDPQKKCINIILKTQGGQNPKLTLNLGRTTLYTVLKSVTDIAEYRWHYIGNTLILEPIPKKKKSEG